MADDFWQETYPQIMCEEQAHKKTCPRMSYRNVNYDSIGCHGSQCPLWRWADRKRTRGVCADAVNAGEGKVYVDD